MPDIEIWEAARTIRADEERQYAATLGVPDAAWPQPFATWAGGEYPSRARPRPLLGWKCSGCGAGWAPHVRACEHCKPKDANTCQPSREGGMCNCDEGGS